MLSRYTQVFLAIRTHPHTLGRKFLPFAPFDQVLNRADQRIAKHRAPTPLQSLLHQEPHVKDWSHTRLPRERSWHMHGMTKLTSQLLEVGFKTSRATELRAKHGRHENFAAFGTTPQHESHTSNTIASAARSQRHRYRPSLSY